MNRTNVKVRKRVAAFLLIVLTMCSYVAGFVPKADSTATAKSYYTIDPGKKMQLFDGWGTSLSWWGAAVGGWDMPAASGLEKREEIARMLFDDNGLNLNIVRYNVGGGDNPDPEHTHMSEFRDVPGYKATEDSDYNWDADANQVWILKRANEIRQKLAGSGNASDMINEFFSVSAPWWMTKSQCSSGLVHNKYTIGENLAHDRIDDFIVYFVDVLQHLIEEEGIDFNYAEPLNEPSSGYWVAGASQEGMDVAPENHWLFYTQLYNELAERGLDVKLAAADETSTERTLLSLFNNSSTPVLNENSAKYYDKLSKVNTHIYSVNDSQRANLKKAVYGEEFDYEAQDKKLWMSEICYKGDTHDHERDMSSALQLARDVTADINLMGVNAWIIWQAVETERSNLLNGQGYGLIHGVYNDDERAEMYVENLKRGDYFATKQYYAMGQYSKYIKSGYRIINPGTGTSAMPNTVAAISPDGREIVLVTTNNKREALEDVNAYFKNFTISSARKIVTSQDKKWEESTLQVNSNESHIEVDFDPYSVTTIVLRGAYDANKSNSEFFFEEFEASENSYYVNYRGPAATLYIAQNPSDLPNSNGTSYKSISLSASTEETKKQFGSISPAFGSNSNAYYGVVGVVAGSRTNYTRVLEFNRSKIQKDADYAYFVSPGKQDRLRFDGIGYGTFGQFNSIADRPYGADMASGKSWGYTNAESATGVFASNDPLVAARSGAATGTKAIEYKFEVEQGIDYDITVVVNDPYKMNNGVNVTISGNTDAVQLIENTNIMQAVSKTNKGNGSNVITVKVEPSVGAGVAWVNLITIRKSSALKKAIAVQDVGPQEISLGESIDSKLPDSVNMLTTKGFQAIPKSGYSVAARDYSHLTDDFPYVRAGCVIDEYGLEFDVLFAADRQYDLYYNIDVGLGTQSRDGGLPFEVVDSFEMIKYFNSKTLSPYQLQTDGVWVDRHNAAQPGEQPQKNANNPTGDQSGKTDVYSAWGRVYGPGSWGNSFTDHGVSSGDKWVSMTQNKATAKEPQTLRYWLPGLDKDTEYIVEFGILNSWQYHRPMKLRIGGTIQNLSAEKYYPVGGSHPELECLDVLANEPVTVQKGANGTAEGIAQGGEPIINVPQGKRYKYSFTTKPDANGVIDFRLYGVEGNEATVQDPILSWLEVKTERTDIEVKPIGAKPERLTISNNMVSYKEKSLTFGNAAQNALVILSDNQGNVIDEKKAAAAGNISFDGLDLDGVKSLQVRQFKDGSASDITTVDVPQIILGKPRTTWSEKAETITVDSYAKDGVGALYVIDERGVERGLGSLKYFRVDRNGTYTVKMVTKSGFTITKQVQITHIDEVELDIVTNLNEIRAAAYSFAFKINALNGVKRVEVVRSGGSATLNANAKGEYTQVVSENQVLQIAVTTNNDSRKIFYVNINNIDVVKPTLALHATAVSGAPAIRFEAQAASSYTIKIQQGDSAAVEYASEVFPLLSSGKYTFILTNAAGVSVSKAVNYYNKIGMTRMLNITGTQKTDGMTVNVETIWDGATVIASRLDGRPEDLTIADGKLELSANGLYQITAIDVDGNTDIITFRVNHIKNQSSDGGFKAGGCGSNIQAMANVQVMLILLVLCAACVTVKARYSRGR